MALSALLLALGTDAGWSAFTVLMRAALIRFAFDPWSFAMAIQLVAGAALLSAAGLHALPLGPLRHGSTWMIGGIRVVTTCCFSAALLYAPATTIMLISTFSAPLATLAVFLFFGRRPRIAETPGYLAILTGAVALTLRLDGGFGNPAVPLVLVSESCVVLASLLAERHPDNLGDRRQRLALTGCVTLLSAGALLTLWSLAGAALPGLSVGAADVSSTLASPWLWIAALGLGAALRAPLIYLSFYVTRLLGAEGYMLAGVALPVTTLLAELAFSQTGLVPPPSLDLHDLAWSMLIVAGGAWIIAVRFRGAP